MPLFFTLPWTGCGQGRCNYRWSAFITLIMVGLPLIGGLSACRWGWTLDSSGSILLLPPDLSETQWSGEQHYSLPFTAHSLTLPNINAPFCALVSLSRVAEVITADCLRSLPRSLSQRNETKQWFHRQRNSRKYIIGLWVPAVQKLTLHRDIQWKIGIIQKSFVKLSCLPNMNKSSSS